MEWKNKTVFLTGASSGIGEGLALALAEKGAILGLLARRQNLLEKIAVECDSKGGKARIYPCDVTDENYVTKAIEDFIGEFGKIDILICNAGIGGSAHAKELTNELFKKVVEVNLMGAVYAVTAALPKMLERNSGQLVAISSLAGFRGLPLSASYSASKGALNNLFESLRIDLLKTNISVTIIQPGFILTPLTSNRKNNLPFLMQLDEAIPLFIRAIEKKKKTAAFPWQLATIVKIGRFLPVWLYDKIVGKTNYREQKD